MLGRHTLLVNPPLINGVAFTRQGRCQEREEVLGTTKPPYTLALLATLLRDAGCQVRLIDLTAERRTIDDLIRQLDADGFTPTLIVLIVVSVYMLLDLPRFGRAIDRRFPPHPGSEPLMVRMDPAMAFRRAFVISSMFIVSNGIMLVCLAFFSEQ